MLTSTRILDKIGEGSPGFLEEKLSRGTSSVQSIRNILKFAVTTGSLVSHLPGRVGQISEKMFRITGYQRPRASLAPSLAGLAGCLQGQV